jgi:hypothetical protein
VLSLALALFALATAAQERSPIRSTTPSKLQIDVSKRAHSKCSATIADRRERNLRRVQFDPQKLQDSAVHLKVSAKSLTAVVRGVG